MRKYLIYKVTNRINGKIYVGQKEGSIEGYLGSGLLIKRAVEKYGRENFNNVVLEECRSRDEANTRETFWINELRAYERLIGYNISKTWFGGDVLSNHPDRSAIGRKISYSLTGKKRSEETKAKLRMFFRSENHPWIGRTIPENERERLKTFVGRKHTAEAREKIAASNRKDDAVKRRPKVYKFNEEFREKSRKNNLGKVLSDETKEKLRQAQLGKKPGNMKAVWVEGQRYESLHAAATATGLPLSTLRNRLSSKNTAFASYYREKP